MSSITTEEEHFLDHEGRRAMALIARQSQPVVHNAPPITFSFYVRSASPYLNSKVHFAALRFFCSEMVVYLQLSGFFDRTTARIVRLEIYDARDHPPDTSVTFSLVEEQARNHQRDERVFRVRNYCTNTSSLAIQETVRNMYDPLNDYDFFKDDLRLHQRRLTRYLVKRINYSADYVHKTGKDAVQWITDEPEYPHPGRGNWVITDGGNMTVLEGNSLLSLEDFQDSTTPEWLPYGPQCPEPQGHMLNPKFQATELMFPLEYSFWKGHPFRFMIFFLDIENDDPTGNWLKDGLKMCFFDRRWDPDEGQVDEVRDNEKDYREEAKEKQYEMHTVQWSSDGTEMRLRDLMLAALPGHMRVAPASQPPTGLENTQGVEQEADVEKEPVAWKEPGEEDDSEVTV